MTRKNRPEQPNYGSADGGARGGDPLQWLREKVAIAEYLAREREEETELHQRLADLTGEQSSETVPAAKQAIAGPILEMYGRLLTDAGEKPSQGKVADALHVSRRQFQRQLAGIDEAMGQPTGAFWRSLPARVNVAGNGAGWRRMT